MITLVCVKAVEGFLGVDKVGWEVELIPGWPIRMVGDFFL